jgi:hypothetical protein
VPILFLYKQISATENKNILNVRCFLCASLCQLYCDQCGIPVCCQVENQPLFRQRASLLQGRDPAYNQITSLLPGRETARIQVENQTATRQRTSLQPSREPVFCQVVKECANECVETGLQSGRETDCNHIENQFAAR